MESSVFAQGMPPGDSFDLWQKLEKLAKQKQIELAVVALWKGKIKIGFTAKEREEFLASKSEKVSLQNFGWVLFNKRCGATTVATTSLIAYYVGLPIIATGGIGGVLLDTDWDISADLYAVANFKTLVISSGVKAFMDVEKTLQFLETYGVPVVGFRTSKFPLFYCGATDYTLPFTLNEPEEVAKFFKFIQSLPLHQGVLLVTNPPETIEFSKFSLAYQKAKAKASSSGISGKEITPFLLNEISKLTDRYTLEINKKLLLQNFLLASDIATQFLS